MNNFFKINNKKLPINKRKYLLNLLNPTTKGSYYYQQTPNMEISKKQIGRVILQCHQMLSLFKSLNISLKNKKMLDIGTGNGMVPKILLEISELKEAVGTDPFLDGEHKSSWQRHSHKNSFFLIKRFISSNKNILDINVYKKFLKFENFSIYPIPISIKNNVNKKKKYKFLQLGAHNISSIKTKFDIIYCKAIEHIHDWEKVVKNINSVSKKNSVVYIKHRSFFSYLGAHRYSSTFIPWGHILMTDKEMVNYVSKFHNERKKDFLDFYFKGLCYPRITVNELLTIFQKYGFILKLIQIEKPRYNNKTNRFIGNVKNFWKIIWKNYPRVSSEEVLSGIYHIVLEKK